MDPKLLSIFRANDIRGVYNRDFDLSFCKTLARLLSGLLYGRLSLEAPRILIGCDARLSSPELAAALSFHLREEGIDAANIGLAPSPLCYFLAHHENLSAAVVVTASHNPPEYNGFKIMLHKKFQIPRPVQYLRDQLKDQSLWKARKNPRRGKGSEWTLDPFAAYISSLKKEFALKPLPFVVDGGNGAIGPLAVKAFSALGLSPCFLFCEPDGRFPNHHPDPTVEENLAILKAKVRETGALFGAGFDGDGDRLVIVTRSGRTVLGDEFGFLFLPSLLPEGRAAGSIIADVKCSDWLFRFVEAMGGRIIMSKSGHSLIREEMEKIKAVFAVEFSGHVFFNDREGRGFDDALYAALRLVEILNQNPDLDSLLPKINSFKTGEIRIILPQAEVEKALAAVKAYLGKKGELFNDLDGIRLSRKTGWALFRSSRTQEALTMRFEAAGKQELFDLKAEFSSVMGVPF